MSDQNDNPEKTRLFFALWPDEAVLAALQQAYQTLGIEEGKAVNPEKIHLTLLFLGNVPNDWIDDLIQMAQKLSLRPCKLVFNRLEHWVRPAVLCLTAEEVPAPLAELHEGLKKGVRKLGFKTEKRPFRPHLTLARKVRKRVIARDIEPISWPVREFTLVASCLDNNGSHYKVLDRWQAKG